MQISLFVTFGNDANDDLPLPERIAQGGKDWQAFPLQSQDVDEKRYYAVQDWIAGVSLTDQPRVVLALMKRRVKKDGIQLFSSCEQLKYRATDGKNYTMDFADAETLYKITQRMDANTGIRNRVLDYLAKAGVIVDEQRIDPSKAIDAGVAGYKRKGKDDRWIESRLQGIQQRHIFTSIAQKTHKYHKPDYSGLTKASYGELFDAAYEELIQRLELTKTEAAHFRDHLGKLAVNAVHAAESAASIKMEMIGRLLTTDEQLEIVRECARLVAPSFKALAAYTGTDLVSGKPVLPTGKPKKK